MSFFTQEEDSSLQLSKMILHVVGDEDFTLEPAQEIEHEQFFIDRIRATDIAPLFRFNEVSNLRDNLQEIANNVLDFEHGAQSLSREFNRFHLGSSRDGAFFIFELTCSQPGVKFYSLIKYDYSEALEQVGGDNGTVLRRIAMSAQTLKAISVLIGAASKEDSIQGLISSGTNLCEENSRTNFLGLFSNGAPIQ